MCNIWWCLDICYIGKWVQFDFVCETRAVLAQLYISRRCRYEGVRGSHSPSIHHDPMAMFREDYIWSPSFQQLCGQSRERGHLFRKITRDRELRNNCCLIHDKVQRI